MPTVQKKRLPGSQLELTIEVTPEEVQPFLEAAVREISTERKIPGFRPGTAPLDLVRRTVGDEEIIKHALQRLVPKTYVEAVQDDDSIEIIGKPDVKAENMVIGQPWRYIATVAVLPDVKLGEYRELTEKRQDQSVEDKEVEGEITKLRTMRASYITVPRPAKAGDQIRGDVAMREGNVPLEGGQARDQKIQLGDAHLLPEFEQALLGVSAGETKEFDITFPKEHRDAALRGRSVTFQVAVKEVQQRILPDPTDEFAKGLGDFTGMDDLRAKLRENILKEKEERDKERVRSSLINQLVERASFGDIPSVLLERELDTMMDELARGVESMGMSFDQYLQQVGKTREAVREGMSNRAEERVKSALALRAVALQEKIAPSEKDIDEEVRRILAQFPDPEEAKKRIDPEELTQLASGTVRNRMVLERLEQFAGIS